MATDIRIFMLSHCLSLSTGRPHLGHLGPKIEASIASPTSPRKIAISAPKASSSLGKLLLSTDISFQKSNKSCSTFSFHISHAYKFEEMMRSINAKNITAYLEKEI